MRVTGRIDRIDHHPDLGWRLIDFKSSDSGTTPDKAHRKSDRWIDLQLPLYRGLHAARLPGSPDAVDIATGYFWSALIPRRSSSRRRNASTNCKRMRWTRRFKWSGTSGRVTSSILVTHHGSTIRSRSFNAPRPSVPMTGGRTNDFDDRHGEFEYVPETRIRLLGSGNRWHDLQHPPHSSIGGNRQDVPTRGAIP